MGEETFLELCLIGMQSQGAAYAGSDAIVLTFDIVNGVSMPSLKGDQRTGINK